MRPARAPTGSGPAAGVRSARRADLDRVAALWTTLTEHHAALDPAFAVRAGAADEMRRLLARQLRDPDTLLLVSERDGDLLGFCTACVERAPPLVGEPERAEITELAVRAVERRRGVGSALVRAALAWLAARGVARVEVRVAVRNREGQGFWRAHGFGDLVDVLQLHL